MRRKSHPHPVQPGCGSDGIHRASLKCVGQVRTQLPHIAASAEAAAGAYVETGWDIVLIGAPALACEVSNRSGGLMNLMCVFRDSKARVNPARMGLRVYFLDGISFENALGARKRWKQVAGHEIAMGPGNMIRKFCQRTGSVTDSLVCEAGTECAEELLLTVQIIFLWTWMAEFVAACTRRGFMPPLFQGYSVPGGKARENRYKGLRFHENPPVPIPRTRSGRQYLREVDSHLRQFWKSQAGNILTASRLAAQARAEGRKLWCFVHGHVFLKRHPWPEPRRIFRRINDGWLGDWKKSMPWGRMQKGDVVLCVGFDALFSGLLWAYFAERAREKGLQLIWSYADYSRDGKRGVAPEKLWITAMPLRLKDPSLQALRKRYGMRVRRRPFKNEMLIDQCWKLGDAVVDFEGYDIRGIPVGGVMAEQVLQCVAAETARQSAMLPQA